MFLLLAQNLGVFLFENSFALFLSSLFLFSSFPSYRRFDNSDFGFVVWVCVYFTTFESQTKWLYISVYPESRRKMYNQNQTLTQTQWQKVVAIDNDLKQNEQKEKK